MIVRELKGLQDIVGKTVVDYHMTENGWRFPESEDECPGAQPDTLYHAKFLREIYFRAQPDYEGRFTVPVLWDKKTESIVNNESSEIIRTFYTEFDSLLPKEKQGVTFYPAKFAKQIDEVNDWVYDTVNNGFPNLRIKEILIYVRVYKCGFATTQQAYEVNVFPLFKSLNRLEEMLSKSSGKYLLGNELTEADIRLYVTIIRFDPVYVQHFKCNLGTIRHKCLLVPLYWLISSYPKLNAWVKHLYWEIPGFKETTNFSHIKRHYMMSHASVHAGDNITDTRSIHMELFVQDPFPISNPCEHIDKARDIGHRFIVEITLMKIFLYLLLVKDAI
jgi:glutathionyl-hydroquinone reductase